MSAATGFEHGAHMMTKLSMTPANEALRDKLPFTEISRLSMSCADQGRKFAASVRSYQLSKPTSPGFGGPIYKLEAALQRVTGTPTAMAFFVSSLVKIAFQYLPSRAQPFETCLFPCSAPRDDQATRAPVLPPPEYLRILCGDAIPVEATLLQCFRCSYEPLRSHKLWVWRSKMHTDSST